MSKKHIPCTKIDKKICLFLAEIFLFAGILLSAYSLQHLIGNMPANLRSLQTENSAVAAYNQAGFDIAGKNQIGYTADRLFVIITPAAILLFLYQTSLMRGVLNRIKDTSKKFTKKTQ
ncbi:MAG: hypothetical protein AB1546_15245 [bacterium]